MNDRAFTQRDVEAIAEATAQRVAEIVGGTRSTFALVGARQLASELGVSTDYVYTHATELGAMRLGAGPKARIRFDVDRARQALEARSRAQNGGQRRGNRVGRPGGGASGRKVRDRLLGE